MSLIFFGEHYLACVYLVLGSLSSQSLDLLVKEIRAPVIEIRPALGA